MSFMTQRGWLARNKLVSVGLASNRAKLKWGKFGQLSNSATKARAGECAGMNRRHEEKDLFLYLE